MPNYSIQLEDGRTINVEGDAPPTVEQLQTLVAPPVDNSAPPNYANEPPEQMGDTKNFSQDIASFGRSLQEHQAPAAGAGIGGLSGGSAGALIGSTFGPVGTIAGGLIGGLGGMAAGANEVQKAQEGFQKATMSHDAYDAYIKQLQDDQENHPLGAIAGETAANVAVAGMRPNLKNIAEAGETAAQLIKDPSRFLEWINNPENADKAGKLINVGLGVGMGTVTAANTPVDNSKLGAIRGAAHIVLGAVLNDSSSFGHIVDSLPADSIGLKQGLQADVAQKQIDQNVAATQNSPQEPVPPLAPAPSDAAPTAEPELTSHLQTNVDQGVMTPDEARLVMATEPKRGMTQDQIKAAAQPHTFETLTSIDSDPIDWNTGQVSAAKRLLDSDTLSPEQKQVLGVRTQIAATEISNRFKALQENILDPYSPEDVAAMAKKNGADPEATKLAVEESNNLQQQQQKQFTIDPAAAPRDEAIDRNIARMGIRNPDKVVADLINAAGDRGDWNEGVAKDYLQKNYGLKDGNAQILSDHVETHYKDQFQQALDKGDAALESWKDVPSYQKLIPKVRDNLDTVIDAHIKDTYAKKLDPSAPSSLNDPTAYLKLSQKYPELPQLGSGQDPQYLRDVLNRATTGKEALATRVAVEGKIRDLVQGQKGIIGRTLDRLNSWRKLAMISGMKTAGRIGISQTLNTVGESIRQPVAYGIDRIGRLFGQKAEFSSPLYKNATEGMGFRLYSERRSIFENMKAFELAKRNGNELPTAAEYKEIDKRAGELTLRVLENSTRNMYETAAKGGQSYYSNFKGPSKILSDLVLNLHAGPAAKVARVAMQNEFDNQIGLVKQYYAKEQAIRDQGLQEAAQLKQSGDSTAAAARISKIDDDVLDLQKKLPSQVDIDAVKAAGLRAANLDPNIWSKAVQSISKIPVVGRPLQELFVPLTRVPGSIFGKLIDYSPVGLAHHLFYGTTPAGRGLYDSIIGAETGNRYDNKRFYNGLARGLIGTGVTAGSFILRNQGIINGSFSKAKKDYKAVQDVKLDGFQEQSINVSLLGRKFSQGFDKPQEWHNGDLIVPYSWASPVGLSMSIGADLHDALARAKGDKIAPDDIAGWTKAYLSATGNSTVTTMLNEPFFRGIQNMASLVAESRDEGKGMLATAGRVLQNAVTDLPAQMVPSLLKNVTNVTNPNRPSIDYQDPINEAVQKFQAAVPGLASQVPTQIGVEGQPYPKQVGMRDPKTLTDYGGKLLDAVFSPVMESRIKMSPVGSELQRLYAVTGSDKALPSRIPLTMKINTDDGQKINIALTPQQREDAQQYVSLKFMALAADKMGRWEYNNQIKLGKPLSEQQVSEMSKLWEQSLNTYKAGILGGSLHKLSPEVRQAVGSEFGRWQ